MLLINHVSMNLFSDKTLIFFFQIFNDLVHLRHAFDVIRISKVILLLSDELYSHFVNLILLLESSFVSGEIILDWRVELSPA